MKKAEAMKQWESGAALLCVEFRMSKCERINWRDKTSGKAMSAPVLRHTVETATEAITVSERLDDNFNVETFKPAFQRGQRVLLHVTEMSTQGGVKSARGLLEPLES